MKESQTNGVKPRKKLTVKLRGDKIIWVVVMLLALISIVAVYSSSSAQAFREGKPISHFLFEQTLFVGIGLAALFFCYLIPLGWYRKLSFGVLFFAIALLILTIFCGEEINGARRWLSLGKITIQPSEVAKIAVILYLARALEKFKLTTFKEYLLTIILPLGVICVLSLWGSVSVILIIGFITLILLVCAGVNKKYLLLTLGIGVVAIGLIFGIHAISPKAFSRLDTFTSRVERFFSKESVEMSPSDKQELKNKQFQEEQAIQAIQLGKGLGRGPGNSLKRNELPHAESDYIYTIIVEEWGLFGGIVVLMLYLWFFSRCILIASSCKKIYSTVTVLGLSLLITMQALLHILVNIGIFPVTGQTLPLISSGGTSFVFMSIAFGIILSVNRTIEISVAKEKLTPAKNEK